MSRARAAVRFVSICSFLFLAGTASAQLPVGFGAGGMVANRPQDDVTAAPAPAVSRLGGLFAGDRQALRRWWLEFSARAAAPGSVVRSTSVQRKLVKRDHVWVP